MANIWAYQQPQLAPSAPWFHLAAPWTIYISNQSNCEFASSIAGGSRNAMLGEAEHGYRPGVIWRRRLDRRPGKGSAE